MIIVNQGETRGDPYAQLRIDAPLGRVLSELSRQLVGVGGNRLTGSAATG